MFKLMHYGETNVGRERKNNEDAFRIAPEAGVYLVCDGMGGHASGEIASQITADVMVRFLAMDRHRPDFRWPAESLLQQSEEGRALDAAVRAANREVYMQAQANQLHKGMGTTIVGMFAGPQRLGLVHVGDSRIYRYREGELELVTDDHSLLNHYIRTRPMSAQQIRQFAGKNVIVRAVGLRDHVDPDIQLRDYHKNDVYLLCSDGLNDMLDDRQIAELMRNSPGRLRETGEALIRAALAAGGRDNVTVLLVQVVEATERPESNSFARRTLTMRLPDDDDPEATSPEFVVEDLPARVDPPVGGQELDEEEQDIINVETMPEIRVVLPPVPVERTQPVKALRPEDFEQALAARRAAGLPIAELATTVRDMPAPRPSQPSPPPRQAPVQTTAEKTEPIPRAVIDALFEIQRQAAQKPQVVTQTPPDPETLANLRREHENAATDRLPRVTEDVIARLRPGLPADGVTDAGTNSGGHGHKDADKKGR